MMSRMVAITMVIPVHCGSPGGGKSHNSPAARLRLSSPRKHGPGPALNHVTTSRNAWTMAPGRYQHSGDMAGHITIFLHFLPTQEKLGESAGWKSCLDSFHQSQLWGK
ncbi:hypothetical protein RRG08_037815 [Elysia crispata]|uniref:Uncharacterized protein n=1 Tax=Elysia crispata TaxID=231223 RepID=A0AAE1BDZ8_9GAST|nr:hypothetical protein RRG08_037815 [Elysia crispata]